MEKLNIQKRQLGEAESITMQNLQRVRRYQRELEDAEGRADQAESSLHLLRAKSRASVVTGKGNSPKVYVLEDDVLNGHLSNFHSQLLHVSGRFL